MSVNYGQNDNYRDIYDGKMANCCQKVRDNKLNQRQKQQQKQTNKQNHKKIQHQNKTNNNNNNKTGGEVRGVKKQIANRMV